MRDILLADDEVLIRTGIRQLLAGNERFRIVAEARSGAEALELFKKYCPNIMILDIRMPGLSGIEVFEQVREIVPATQAIFISAYSDISYMRAALKNEAVDYIIKPIAPDEILKGLERANARLARMGVPEKENYVRENKNEQSQRLTDEMKRYMRNNYARNISVTQIADAAYLSPAYACTLFKKNTGDTILHFLMQTRMEAAMALLKNMELSPESVSGRVGYQDYRYFRQLFFRNTGVFPEQYAACREEK